MGRQRWWWKLMKIIIKKCATIWLLRAAEQKRTYTYQYTAVRKKHTYRGVDVIFILHFFWGGLKLHFAYEYSVPRAVKKNFFPFLTTSYKSVKNNNNSCCLLAVVVVV
jgi:hypothetical protein